MHSTTQELFARAAKYFIKLDKEKIGSQKKLARELDVSQAYLSSVLSGSRAASLDLYTQIAERLYGPFDKFLAVGRSLKEGKDPFAELGPGETEDAEHLIARLSYYILDHKRIEKELNELKEFYENIIEKLQSAVLVMNGVNEIVYANGRVNNLCGISPNEILGKSPFNIEKSIPGLNIYAFTQKYLEACEQLSPLYFENIKVTTNLGESHYNSGWLIPMTEDGKFTGMVCTIRDTSHSHALFSLLTETVEVIPDGVILLQQRNATEKPFAVFANKKFREILGLDALYPLTLPFDDLLNFTKKMIKNKEQWQQHVMDTLQNNTVNARFVIEHVNGKSYDLIGNPLTDKHGLHIGRMAVLKERK